MANVYGTFNYLAWRHGYDDGVADTLYGTVYSDYIQGYGGADWLYGFGGHDTIDGGRGNDTIRGGTGVDWMTGGSGYDQFRFQQGDSGPSYAAADVITDFNGNQDTVYFDELWGTSSNYVEYGIAGDGTYDGTYARALAYANEDIGGKVWFAFYTDGQDGYLFADLDLNGNVDTGIELRGLTSLNQFDYWNIV
jgi:Ca2+-binding RTX toxin-like protein